MTTAAVIQARMGSTRCPGKVLTPLAGVPMLEHIIKRLQGVNGIDAIVLAVPEGANDAPLAATAEKTGVGFIQGPEEDVLQRFLDAGRSVNAQHLVRVCADNPLFDPILLQSLLELHFKSKADHTITPDAIPLGTGTEVVRMAALERISELSDLPAHREHVTTYFKDHPDAFRIAHLPAPAYLKDQPFRLTVDTQEDVALMQKIHALFYDPQQTTVDLPAVLAHLKRHPELANSNAHIEQKDWRR